MKFEQQKPEAKQSAEYNFKGENSEIIKLNRDDILEEAALVLQNYPDFPDARENVNIVRAKGVLIKVLKKHGVKDFDFDLKLEKQLQDDAYEILDLFNLNKK